MRWSRFFAPTLKETPSEAEVPSHRLLLRAAFIRQLGSGIYSFLPLARRTLRKIETIIRCEMDAIGAQEFVLPALHPAEPWRESGRWDAMGDEMFRLQDRSGRDMCLGMTHEEIFTTIARDEIRSYRELPQIWYQIQLKFRDEPRPKSGLLRVRHFHMKDSYSFDLDAEGLDRSYRLHEQAYRRIFDRCGLRYLVVEADSGAMGGSVSHEFMVRTNAGEDHVVTCACGYASNLDRAVSALEAQEDEAVDLPPRKVHTPGRKTIQEVSDFLDVPRSRQIKSLVYMVEDTPWLLLLRGDHQLNDLKLSRAAGTGDLRMARSEEIRELFGAGAGSLGPVGADFVKVVADRGLEGRTNLVCGANQDDYHLLHVTPGRDFQASYQDLRLVEQGDSCSDCGQPVQVEKTLEIGHIFKLGYKYSESMGARVLDRQGKERPWIMGSYGIGLERIMAAAVELYHDKYGIVWPRALAPFQAVITVVRVDDRKQFAAAREIYRTLWDRGIDCLLDDRDVRPGFKFKDAELIGVPIRITVGRALRQGRVEIFSRQDHSKREVPLGDAVKTVLEMLQEYPL